MVFELDPILGSEAAAGRGAPWLLLAALVVGSALATWVGRALRVPGVRLLAGVLVGAALGPTLLGRLAPEAWERAAMGGSAERTVLLARQAELSAWKLARGSAGAGPDATATAELSARTASIAEAEAAWRHAVVEHQRPLRVATLLLAGIVAASAVGRRSGGHPAPWPTAISVGLWSAGVPISIGLLVLWLRDERLLSPSAFAGLAAMAVGAWGLNSADRQAALRAGSEGPMLVAGASGVATAIAAFLAAAGVLGGPAPDPWLALGTITVLGSAGLVGAWRAVRGAERAVTEAVGRSRIALAVEATAIPALAGCVAFQADWIADVSPWIVIGILVASGDGRWSGAWCGVMLSGGRRPLDAARLALGACGSGPLQVAIAAIAVTSGLLSREWTVAVVLGAVATDMTAPLRRRFSQAID